MPQTAQRIVAGGTINTYRFVKPDPSADHQGLQADANAEIIGVSGGGTKYAPLSDLVSTNPHAASGDPVELYGNGEEAFLEVGSAVAAGDLLKADANGRAVPIASTGTTVQNYGARAQHAAAASGERIRVDVLFGKHRPALS